ncbi:TetR/AcrR family transcriptional regulator [Phytopseudomonas dryadis]|uniref:TetR/AcrR family transcriptional regulator n=1 Tax=Phytopseudomonas dryadis TaxID=2487520 RepID=A0A4V2KC03_9GAMM|nr:MULTISPECIES: TetR/AcrR family transcriptional regulator [Pseudomonas]TBU90305.1 TetR/AcrR family transcriptional regulator [Pseudomonas dryadis]TBV04437.1 TetR/AcrR family transcriptional regulator [Pseudomonas dryadis]TBV17163.1 TetR/AcrR family transcriptional regulator [Pseudomonas sp. FRB 230]
MTAVLRPAAEPLLRQQLCATARQLFARHGFHAVSLRQLGQALGLHAGSLYAHIESKDALLQELIEEGFERLIDSARRVPAGAGLAGFLRHHLAFQQANPDWYVLALVESRHLTAEAREDVRSLKGDYALLLERLLQARCGGHGEPWRIATVARQALRLLDGPPGGEGASLDDCVDDLERLILNRLGP